MSMDVLSRSLDKVVRDLVTQSSIEILPKDAIKISSEDVIIAPGTRVYIAYASSSPKEIVEAARIVRDCGHSPVPHIPARRLESEQELLSFVKALTKVASIDEVLLIGGDNATPVGPFRQTMDVLGTGVLEDNGIRAVGVAGYPEGHPTINLDEQRRALIDKCAYADRNKLAIHITTQFLFDTAKLFAWHDNFIRPTADIPVDVGLPGLAKMTTLLRFAKDCGVSASVGMFSKHAARAFKLATSFSPDELLVKLATGIMNEDENRFRSVHFYPFGSLLRTAKWINAMRAGSFIVNERKRTISIC